MKKLLFAVVVFSLVFLSVMPAVAQGPVTVNTSGQVTGSCAPPTWVAGWELPVDLLLHTGGVIYPYPGPATTAINTFAIFDYGSISDGISSAFVSVYHPDGSIKYSQINLRKLDCTEASAVLAAAVAEGLISEATRVVWQQNICQLQWEMWAGSFDYDVHQASGTYSVYAYATGICGGATLIGNSAFTIAGFTSLAIDFSASGVNYGQILPGYESWAQGDLVFDPNASANPTVWNQGNLNATLWVSSSPLKPGAPWTNDTVKWITRFNASMGNLALRSGEDGFQPSDYDYVGENAVVYYNANALTQVPGVLFPCTPNKASFSVDPPAGQVLPASTYTGTMTLSIQ